MGIVVGKRIQSTGSLSNRSIAYGITQACQRKGADLAFTYIEERFEDRTTGFATGLGSDLVFHRGVADDVQIETLFVSLRQY